MGKKVFKKTKVLVLFGLVLVLALTMGLAGCKKQQLLKQSAKQPYRKKQQQSKNETSSDTNGNRNKAIWK